MGGERKDKVNNYFIHSVRGLFSSPLVDRGATMGYQNIRSYRAFTPVGCREPIISLVIN